MQMSSQKADEKPEASPKTTGGIRARLAKLGGGIPMPGLGGAPRPPPMPSSKPVEETKDGVMKHDTLKRASGPRRRRTAKVAKFTADKAVVEAVDDAPPPAPSSSDPPPMPPPAP